VNKRTLKLGFLGCLVALGVLLGLLLPGKAKGDEQRFGEMRSAQRRILRIRLLERYLPLFLITKLHLGASRLTNDELVRADQEALLASGFLTQASLNFTNLPASVTNRFSAFLELQSRLRTVPDLKYCIYRVEGDRAVVICRSSDLPRIRSRVEAP
jgi:hypothetical protein